MIALAAVVVGLVLSLASGGSIRGLEQVKLRFELPVIVLFVVQAVARGRVAGTAATAVGLGVWVLSCAALLIMLLPDWRRPGIWLISMGLGLNLFVVLANGGMPVFLPTGAPLAGAAASIARSLGFYQLAGPGTLAGHLGDTILLAVAGYRILLSPGDVLLAVGVVALIVDAAVRPPRAVEPA